MMLSNREEAASWTRYPGPENSNKNAAAVYETWSWDGYRGESVIFTDNDVGGLADKVIRKVVRTSGLVDKGTKVIVDRS